MRVLLDTNVLVAAFIAHGTCHEVLEVVVRHHRLVTSQYVLKEFERCLRTKFGYGTKEVREAVSLVSDNAEVVEPLKVEVAEEIDTDDLPVLGTAVAGSCDCLVTGDKELLELGRVHKTAIISPAQFWRFEDRES